MDDWSGLGGASCWDGVLLTLWYLYEMECDGMALCKLSIGQAVCQRPSIRLRCHWCEEIPMYVYL